MLSKNSFALAVIGFIASFALPAYTSPQIQAYFNQWAQNNEIVGAALTINNHSYAYGYSDRQAAKLVTTNTQFGIGSITKTFISVVILKLEAKGMLNIHDSITKYLPQYYKLKDVSIQKLLQMTAGFNDIPDLTMPRTPLEEVKASYSQYNPKLAGTWQYSNASYQLIGILIEKITHQTLSNVVSTLITTPLHLNSIYFPTKTEAAALAEYQNDKVKKSDFNKADAAGGLIGDAKDLEIFIRHLFVMKDLLPSKQFSELTSFIDTSTKYYAFTGTHAPQFGLAVFKWNLEPYGSVLTYPGVTKDGYTSAYIVIRDDVIISQSNTYNHGDYTILWPYREFTKGLFKIMN